MLKHIVFCLTSLTLFTSSLHASPDTNPLIEAFKSGNWKYLAKAGDHRMEIYMNGKDGLYEYTESAAILKRFFASHQPLHTDVIQDNSSSKGSAIAILRYVSQQGVYKITLYSKTISASSMLEEIRIEQFK